jgi:type IV pilus assembly protein PilQ
MMRFTPLVKASSYELDIAEKKGVGSMSLKMTLAAVLVVMAIPVTGSANPSTAQPEVDDPDSGAIESVEIKNLYKNQFQQKANVIIQATEVPDYTLFRLDNPIRIVVDIPKKDIADVKLPADYNGSGVVQRISTTQFQGRTGTIARVVIALNEDADVSAKVEGRSVVVSIDYSALATTRKRETVRKRHGASDSMSAHKPVDPGVTPVVRLSNDAEAVKAAGRLTAVHAKANSQGAIVTLATDGQIQRYEIEEVENPPRLVIDLYGIKARKKMDKEWTLDALKRARVGIHHKKTRVVIDGRDEVLPAYDVASTNEGLKIVFANLSRTKTAEYVKVRAFQHESKKGFERLQAKTAGSVTVRTVANGPRKKTIALDGVHFDKDHFGFKKIDNPVIDGIEVSPGTRDGSVHVSLLVNEDVEHSVWQKEGMLFWDVRDQGQRISQKPKAITGPQPRAAGYATALTLSAHEGMAAKRYRGKKITIDLQEADIVNVIRLLGDVSGMNVVIDEEVAGNVTIKLKNVPWDQALDVILRTKSLGKEVKGGIIRIALQSKLDAERQARLTLQQEMTAKQPTAVRLIPVNYAVASELMEQVKEVLSERGKVSTDDRTNVIVVEDIRVNLDQAEQLVRTLDTETPLVLIEARMVEASTSFSRSLGIQWGGGLLSLQENGNSTGLIFPNNLALQGSSAGADIQTPGVNSPTNYAINLPASGGTTGVGLNMGSIGNNQFLTARITAAETTGEAKLVSAPKITTLNNEEARISQGVDKPVTVTTDNQITTQIIQARLELVVTPHVTADGSILLRVRISNNDLKGAAGLPEISTKEAETQMLVKNGDTAVIGGIYTRQYFEDYKLTPFLGSIPVIGWLFKASNTVDNRAEMLVFLSPRIVNRKSVN